jgi:SAM-dependent methyltransferase
MDANPLSDLLASCQPARLLDLATGGGHFLADVLAACPGATCALGVDRDTRTLATFRQLFAAQPQAHFARMDVTCLALPDAACDLVSVSNSLHHFRDPAAALREAQRVLRPGGVFVLSEMTCEPTREAQRTHVRLHHWWAEIDMRTGGYHRATYSRAELLALAAVPAWAALDVHDLDDTTDPFDPETLADLEGTFPRQLARAAPFPDLAAQGEALRDRLQAVGFQHAPRLLVIGRKAV